MCNLPNPGGANANLDPAARRRYSLRDNNATPVPPEASNKSFGKLIFTHCTMVFRLPKEEDTVNNNFVLVTLVSFINRMVSYIIRPG